MRRCHRCQTVAATLGNPVSLALPLLPLSRDGNGGNGDPAIKRARERSLPPYRWQASAAPRAGGAA